MNDGRDVEQLNIKLLQKMKLQRYVYTIAKISRHQKAFSTKKAFCLQKIWALVVMKHA